MEKIVFDFTNKFSLESQLLIQTELNIKRHFDKFLPNSEANYFINDFDEQKKVDENRIIGEFSLAEIELIIIKKLLMVKLGEQKESIHYYKQSLASMKEAGYGPRERRGAKEELLKREGRLSVLFNEHDNTANYLNNLIGLRLKNEIELILNKNSDICKCIFRYDAYRRDRPGYLFRVCYGNKIALDNKNISGGD